MPDRRWRPDKPTFYLDYSTLADAFGATESEKYPREYLALRPWVERVASDANVCVSFVHLNELAGWADPLASKMAAWLDVLPLVWCRSVVDTQIAEDEFWTKVAAGVTPKGNVAPFAASMISSFTSLTVDQAASLLAERPGVAKIIEALRVGGRRNLTAGSLALANGVRVDRAWMTARNITEKQLQERIASNARVDLRTRARDAHDRLTRSRDEDYARRPSGGPHIQDALVDLVKSNPHAMPTWRVMLAFNMGFTESAARAQAGSNQEKRRLGGSAGDAMHLAIGAAYCDVFTCDRATSAWLGDARTAIGRQRQLARGDFGWDGAFVTALTSTWPR